MAAVELHINRFVVLIQICRKDLIFEEGQLVGILELNDTVIVLDKLVKVLESQLILDVSVLLGLQFQPLEFQVPQILQFYLQVLIFCHRNQCLVLRLDLLQADCLAPQRIIKRIQHIAMHLFVSKLLSHLEKHIPFACSYRQVFLPDFFNVVWKRTRLNFLYPLALFQTLPEVPEHLIEVLRTVR